MKKVRCYECGRSYDYHEDPFCPRCGAFNQAAHSTCVGADGSIVRVDGINETNHAGSFLHKEYHEEEKERKRTGLDKGVQRIPSSRPVKKRTTRKAPEQITPAAILRWVVLGFIALQFLGRFLLIL